MTRIRRRIAFLGGTFDPPHNGHLDMANAALIHLDLDLVYFVPAWRNPHKSDQHLSSAEHRLEMLRLLVLHEPRFGIWEGELLRGGPSYTVDSVKHIERVYPNSHLFWIIGSDQLNKLDQWYGVETLVRKVGFILLQRPGFAFHWPRIPGLTLYPVDNPLNPASSTEIRTRLRDGQTISDMVPSSLERYLQEHPLYQDSLPPGQADETIR